MLLLSTLARTNGQLYLFSRQFQQFGGLASFLLYRQTS
jgi:hypothetical protein